MMNDLSELYQEVILDHNRKPRNFYEMKDASRYSEGFNPLCGDKISLYLKMVDEIISEISFQGSGCAISKASASLMTIALKGKKKDEAIELFEKFHQMVTGKMGDRSDETPFDSLKVFSGVKEYPARVKCATLAWHTLRSALELRKEITSTE